ncbi:MAG: lysylphosphatidylglycerol synthase domain-containing protein [candidate division Zixibacteria bacterium]|nr:lysylphosphatidylglycerol synthase domain-containing protein [candidate division Zixibacteria bacterium]
MPKKIKFVKSSAKFLIVLVILFFFTRYIYTHWTSLSQYQWRFDYKLLFSSLILVIANYIFLIQIWRRLIFRMGYFLKFKKAFKIFFYSSMGKYVPGKVWSVLGMVYMCEKEGISVKVSVASAVLNQALNMIGGLLLVVIVSGTKFLGGLPKIAYLPLALILIIFIYPPLMESTLNVLLKLLKKETISINLSFRDNLAFTLLFILSWCVYGVAFNIFIRSLTPFSWNLLPFLSSAFAFSYIIGFLSVFVPGGLGVREGILVFYLSSYFPLPVATLIALLSRLWMTAAEILCLAVSSRL